MALVRPFAPRTHRAVLLAVALVVLAPHAAVAGIVLGEASGAMSNLSKAGTALDVKSGGGRNYVPGMDVMLQTGVNDPTMQGSAAGLNTGSYHWTHNNSTLTCSAQPGETASGTGFGNTQYSAAGKFRITGTNAPITISFTSSGTPNLIVHAWMNGPGGRWYDFTGQGNTLAEPHTLVPGDYDWHLIAEWSGTNGTVTGAVGTSLHFPGFSNVPDVTMQPHSQVVPTGPVAGKGSAATNAVATLTVATDATSPSYQWRRNYISLADGGAISGSHTASLNFASFSASLNGIYDCIVRTAEGSAASDPAALEATTVTNPPTITRDPTSVVDDGNAAEFDVLAAGTGTVTYQWRRNNVALGDGAQASGALIVGANGPVLTILGPTPADEAGYTCVVTNEKGSRTSLAAQLLSSTTGVPIGAPAAAQVALAAPVPNPARGAQAVAIAFTLAHAGRARLALYDAAGRRIRALADANCSAGPHTTSWDGLDDRGARVPPGVYLLRLGASSGASAVQRMVIEPR